MMQTLLKTQMERHNHEYTILKQENDKLRIENIALKEATRNLICTSCSGPASLGEISIEEQHLRAENARLRDKLNRLRMMASKCLGGPVSSLIGSTSLNSGDASLPVGLDCGSGFNSALSPLIPPRTMSSNSFDASIDQSMFIQLAVNAMNELVMLAQFGSPMWFNSSNRSGVMLNLEEYIRTFPLCIGMKPTNFSTQATRASGTVMINSIALTEILMGSNRLAELFPSIIGSAATIDTISSSVDGTRNGVLQLMQAQFQVLSPLIPARHVKFLRFCKQQAEGIWAVVDVSVDADRAGGNGGCRRLPSGCLIQDMPNGHSKVIWVEHMEYDESDVRPYFRPLLKSGIGFGAQRWITNLERQCECLAFLMSSASTSRDLSVISHSGRRSMAKLAQRMTHSFCSGICGTLHKWDTVEAGSHERAKVMIRNSNGNPGEPPGVILSASFTAWMPVSQHRVLEYLLSTHIKPHRDVQQLHRIAKGQELGNCIYLFYSYDANKKGNGHDIRKLTLLDTSMDKSGAMVVQAPIDIAEINVVVNGGDSSRVALLPSGFAVFPDGGGKGCLLTVGSQFQMSNMPSPTARPRAESIEALNGRFSRLTQTIRSKVQSS